MNQPTGSKPMYSEKLNQLIGYLKKPDNPNRDAVLNVIKEGGYESVSEMLMHIGEEQWSNGLVPSWTEEDLAAVTADWEQISGGEELAIFWTW